MFRPDRLWFGLEPDQRRREGPVSPVAAFVFTEEIPLSGVVHETSAAPITTVNNSFPIPALDMPTN
jgi:hypothetical protein